MPIGEPGGTLASATRFRLAEQGQPLGMPRGFATEIILLL